MAEDESSTKPAEHPLVDDDDDGKSAADDPTDVWDEEALRKAGLDSVVERLQARAATRPEDAGGPSIEVAPELVEATRSKAPPLGALPAAAPAGPPSARGLSWPVTIGLALAVGALAYLLVRLLR